VLADGPKEIPDEAMNTIERFDRISTCTKVDHPKRKVFPHKKKIGAANPTSTRCSNNNNNVYLIKCPY